jgi:hypothetical protein
MSYRNPIHWRLRKVRYRLVGSACPHCARPSFPPGRPCCQPRPAASSGLVLVPIRKQIRPIIPVIMIDSQIKGSTKVIHKETQNEPYGFWIQGVGNEIEAL